jgi:single stranded DNA-binding protein
MRVISIIGRIVNDAEKRVTQNGREYITFRFASNEYSDPKDENGKTVTYWYNVTSFQSNYTGENFYKHLTKGKPIVVIGDYRDNIYQNKISGNCEIGRYITAQKIDFISEIKTDEDNKGVAHQTANAEPVNVQTQTSMPKTQTRVLTPEEEDMVKNSGLKGPLVSSDDDLPF